MKVTESEQDLKLKVHHLLRSVVDSISEAQSLKGKWSLIGAKLSGLETEVSDLSDFPPNSLSLDLLRSFSSTLSDALSLSLACRGPTLPHGKLKTQNDVDSISATIDDHIRDCEVLIKSGVLRGDVVSTASSTSPRIESVRVESRNLVTRLQIGTTESRNSAMDCLLGFIREDDRNAVIAVAQGVVPVLVRVLDSTPSHETREKAVTAIARVSAIEACRDALLAEGLPLLHDLLRVLESGSGFAKEKACIALLALTQSRENARAIGSRGGISALLHICLAGTPSSQSVAVGVLRNLSKFPDTVENFGEENAIPTILAMARSGTVLAQEQAIGCLSNLIKEDNNLKISVIRGNGIEILKNFWDSSPALPCLEPAIGFLRNFSSMEQIVDALISQGLLSKIISVLNCGDLGVRIEAANAIYDFGSNPRARSKLGECGCIPLLVRMLDGKAVEEREAAAKALSIVLVSPGNRKLFSREERGIVSAVQLLDPSALNLDKEYPVLILSSLVHSKKCRKQMVASGAYIHLQKLAEMEVEGAKKLLERLGRGKLWGVFARP